MPGHTARRTPIDVDRIMERIREEVRRQERQEDEAPLPDRPLSTRPVRCRDLLRYRDEAFLRQAYRVLLNRMPEPEGLEFWLHKLRDLGWARVDILWSIRTSREGQIHAVPVRGLRWRVLLRRAWAAVSGIPVLGWALRWAWALLRLPRIAAAVSRLERVRLSEATEGERRASLLDTISAMLRRLDALEERSALEDGRRRKRDTRDGGGPPQPDPPGPAAPE